MPFFTDFTPTTLRLTVHHQEWTAWHDQQRTQCHPQKGRRRAADHTLQRRRHCNLCQPASHGVCAHPHEVAVAAVCCCGAVIRTHCKAPPYTCIEPLVSCCCHLCTVFVIPCCLSSANCCYFCIALSPLCAHTPQTAFPQFEPAFDGLPVDYVSGVPLVVKLRAWPQAQQQLDAGATVQQVPLCWCLCTYVQY